VKVAGTCSREAEFQAALDRFMTDYVDYQYRRAAAVGGWRDGPARDIGRDRTIRHFRMGEAAKGTADAGIRIGGITPEEDCTRLGVGRVRIARVMRQLFAALVSWRRKVSDWHAASEPTTRVALEH
jgi:hypothetical protein